MNRTVRDGLAFTGLVALLYVGYQVYHAGDGISDLLPRDSGEIVLDSGHAYARKIDSKAWSVEYDRIVANSDQTLIDLYGVHNAVVYKAGKRYLRLRADHATVNTITHDFYVNGHVHVESIDVHPAKAFDTATARWNDASKILDMPQTIAITYGSQPPLMVGSLSYNVKTGDIDISGLAGPARTQE